ncbi:MAG: xanthine dehydrogenase family protein molybdopterin-binding subunit [Rhodospirillales bacterium]|nr:xanthine dehydrogenase family protein molybdopterin-binding subunit [Rhodospirillales bacterium]
MVKFGIGQPVRRVEDQRLLTGAGNYLDDVVLPRQAYAHFLRSPHAHAKLVRIDADAARAAPGVLGVFTGADLKAAGIGNIPCNIPLQNRNGSPLKVPPRPAIAQERVRFVGDTVAMVVAETLAEAKDAAELIEVEYDPLPAIADSEIARAEGAPQIWDFAKDNVAFDWTTGDEAKTKVQFAEAHRAVRIDLVNNRVVPNSMEPRGAIGAWSSAEGRWTLYASTQGGSGLRKMLAGDIFKVPENRVRVVTGDVGGGFGMKLFLYPEYIGAMFAARALGRPVKWTGERSDAFLTDSHGRDHRTHAELALNKDGKFLGLHVRTTANLGAYFSNYGPFIPTMAGSAMLAGCYTTPAIFVEVTGVYTNTAPLDAYRGAGRPEANYVVERIVDAAARETGLGPDEIRRRNFIPPSAMPYRTALGSVYDSGEFAKNMDDAIKAADWAGFPARRAEAAKRGKLRGIGMATYIEACGGGNDETAQIRFDAAGGVAVLIGNQSNGQGHETTYAQLVADRLGVPFESVRVIQGDTDQILYPGLTGGSRMLSVGGSAVLGAAERIIAKGKKLTAHLLEAAEADIEFEDGVFRIAGTDRTRSMEQIVKASFNMAKLPKGMSPGLDETSNHIPAGSTFPNGCHICELEIDRATGTVEIVRYTVVDDFGKVVNPLMLAGQVHGGTVQGIGQALYESCVYDRESGQLLTGSFMDYCMPRADDVPFFSFAYNEVPCRNNPLGVKGSGEAGAIGAPPATINAVVDALTPFGIRNVDMPATPEKIWRLIDAAGAKQAAE